MAAPHRTVPARTRAFLALLSAVWGPGFLVMLADTDVGNIVTAAQSGAEWGFRLLPLPLLLIPLLYILQELAVRIGLVSGSGVGELIRARCGQPWTAFAASALAVATLGSLVTELAGIAGIADMYGVTRWLALPLASSALLAVMLSGEYRRTERAVVLIGLFQFTFFAVAYAAKPRFADVARDIAAQPWHDPRYLYLTAALIGTTFNPWMIFYQPSALVEKRFDAVALGAARWDTATGAVLTQVLTAAILVAAAATLAAHGAAPSSLDSVGGISRALAPLLGRTVARFVFGAGVIGAAMVAAVVCSLAFAWGIGELAGLRRSREHDMLRRRWFSLAYGGCVVGSTLIILVVPDLVWLSILAQIVNALLLPFTAGLLIVAAARYLPPEARMRGWYLWIAAIVGTVVSAAGVIGALAGQS